MMLSGPDFPAEAARRTRQVVVETPYWLHVPVSVTLVSCAYGLSALKPLPSMVCEINGATFCALYSIVLPCVLYLRLMPTTWRRSLTKLVAMFVLLCTMCVCSVSLGMHAAEIAKSIVGQ